MRKSKFNLLELVLIITVFFIMSGIMIPTLAARKKEDPAAALCADRKKRLLAAIISYTNDNNGQFIAWENGRAYTVSLVKGKYIGGKIDDISCPAVRNL